MKINQLDLFSGIGGFHLGFERAGYEVQSYFSEIDQHAIAVYKHQFKDSKYVGAVRDVRGADLPNIDLITFGSPCQDFSLAGRRKGMEGERSVLILEAIRLIKECRPRAFVWENVKGTFSSNDGADFAAILQAFTNIGGYRLEWELLNTSWFLPQNRERIYLVGYSTTPKGDWRGVFPIGEESRENTKLPKHNLKTHTILQRYEAATANGSYISECELPPQKVKVKSGTKCGYEIATEGDSISLVQESSTRRGRVGKKKAQTIQPTSNQGVIQLDTKYTYEAVNRIRRLTPIECERLQGFPDNHTEYGNYDGVIKKMSNTQRYKQCGNAVTVVVVQAVAQKMKYIYEH
tara:strand:+ start:119 stop:1162 length:1044 start_codon:yes stop_codon:yes gene_type:complete